MGDHSERAVERRRDLLAEQGIDLGALVDREDPTPEELAGNIENFVGFAQTPVGVIGPLRIDGDAASGDFYVPLATTEGALVASYNRGAMVCSQSSGIRVAVTKQSVGRAPCFQFECLAEAESFLNWVLLRLESFQQIVARTSNHCQLIDCQPRLLGREVHLLLEFSTGDAAGQNMVTIATDSVCRELLAAAPIRPVRWLVEGNLSGDKKPTSLSFHRGRGHQTVADVVVDREHVRRFLHTDPVELVRAWQIVQNGGVQSGAIGVQCHAANALAALFIATGQDVACVAESAVGTTQMDVTDAGHLYVCVSLPSVLVGTVGGGTRFPTAQACLRMLGCSGNAAAKLAAICCATVVAGEVSIMAALASGDFTDAHARLGRPRNGCGR